VSIRRAACRVTAIPAKIAATMAASAVPIGPHILGRVGLVVISL